MNHGGRSWRGKAFHGDNVDCLLHGKQYLPYSIFWSARKVWPITESRPSTFAASACNATTGQLRSFQFCSLLMSLSKQTLIAQAAELEIQMNQSSIHDINAPISEFRGEKGQLGTHTFGNFPCYCQHSSTYAFEMNHACVLMMVNVSRLASIYIEVCCEEASSKSVYTPYRIRHCHILSVCLFSGIIKPALVRSKDARVRPDRPQQQSMHREGTPPSKARHLRVTESARFPPYHFRCFGFHSNCCVADLSKVSSSTSYLPRQILLRTIHSECIRGRATALELHAARLIAFMTQLKGP